MSFVEAFKTSVIQGRLIRRRSWTGHTATLRAVLPNLPAERALAEATLIRFPEGSHWSGEYSPSLEEAEATDWEAV